MGGVPSHNRTSKAITPQAEPSLRLTKFPFGALGTQPLCVTDIYAKLVVAGREAIILPFAPRPTVLRTATGSLRVLC